jgi:hypothetical protein
VFGVFAAALGVVQAANGPTRLKITLAAIAVAGALIALVFLLLERRAQQRERDRAQDDAELERVRLLRTTVVGKREHVPRLSELSAYDLGVDHEQITLGRDGTWEESDYLERDRDVELRRTLDLALRDRRPRMIINPDPVEPPAEGSVLICCSRPHDDVVLDL